MSDWVTRPEFDGAVESLRRELKTMGENLGAQLSQVLDELKGLRKETGKVAVLEVRVDALEAWKNTRQKTERAWALALIGSFVAHLLTFWRK